MALTSTKLFGFCLSKLRKCSKWRILMRRFTSSTEWLPVYRGMVPLDKTLKTRYTTNSHRVWKLVSLLKSPYIGGNSHFKLTDTVYHTVLCTVLAYRQCLFFMGCIVAPGDDGASVGNHRNSTSLEWSIQSNHPRERIRQHMINMQGFVSELQNLHIYIYIENILLFRQTPKNNPSNEIWKTPTRNHGSVGDWKTYLGPYSGKWNY